MCFSSHWTPLATFKLSLTVDIIMQNCNVSSPQLTQLILAIFGMTVLGWRTFCGFFSQLPFVFLTYWDTTILSSFFFSELICVLNYRKLSLESYSAPAKHLTFPLNLTAPTPLKNSVLWQRYEIEIHFILEGVFLHTGLAVSSSSITALLTTYHLTAHSITPE